MNAETIPSGQLACLLRDAAAGMLADMAAVDLICRERPLPGRPRLPAHHRRRQQHHHRAAAGRHPVERRCPRPADRAPALLRVRAGDPEIAASLAEPGIAISLRDCLGNLDQRNITLVTAAITAANG